MRGAIRRKAGGRLRRAISGRRGRLGGVLVVLALVGCAGRGLVAHGRGADRAYHHPRLGYRVGVPEPERPGRWQRVDVDGADLAFREDVPAAAANLSLLSECRGSRAAVDIQARHLVAGLSDRSLQSQGPTEVDGVPAWVQTLEAGEAGRRVHLVAVSAVRADCVYDWLLVLPRADGSVGEAARENAERVFESWRSSFRFGAAERGGEGAERGVASPEPGGAR